MNIVVHSRNKGKRALIEAAAKLYKQELRLTSSKYTVEIQFKKDLLKEGIKGSVCQLGPQYILMLLDSGLKDERLFETLAHEMIHVKQYAKGQYKTFGAQRFWMGRRVRAKYWDQPWEREAMSKEKLLAGKIYTIIANT